MADVGLTKDGDLPEFTEHITGLALIRQKIRIRLQTFLGEWMLDTRAGMPFFRWLAQKPVRTDEIENHVRAEITAVSGVVEVVELSVAFDRTTKAVEVRAELRTDFGDADVSVQATP